MTAWCISPFAVLLTSLSVSIAGAKELHPGIIGEDDRITIRADTSPWDAIGHVNIAGYRTISKCSGILIAPTAVLTAAHCLVDTREMAPVPPDRVHFLQAVHGGTWKGQSVAKCILFAGANSSTGLAHKDRWLRDDIAVIILKESLEGSRVEIAETLDTRPGTYASTCLIPCGSPLRSVGRPSVSIVESGAGSLVHQLRYASRQFWRTGIYEGGRVAETCGNYGRNDGTSVYSSRPKQRVAGTGSPWPMRMTRAC